MKHGYLRPLWPFTCSWILCFLLCVLYFFLLTVKQALKEEKELVSFGVCANVLIAPSVRSRNLILTSIHETMKDGGLVVFVVPSLESSLYCEWRWWVHPFLKIIFVVQKKKKNQYNFDVNFFSFFFLLCFFFLLRLHTGPTIQKNSDQIPHDTGIDAELILSGAIPRDGWVFV